MPPRRPPPSPPRSALTSAMAARPASTPLVAAATGADKGIGSTGARSITRASGGSARTGRLRPSSMERASLLLDPEVLLVHPVALRDSPTHPLHGAVHGLVGLEDPAHLAALLRRLLRHVEVLPVQQRRNTGVLVLGLDAEEADSDLVDRAQLGQHADPAEREQPPVGLLERL